MREEIIGDCRLILGDCRDVLPELWVFDLLLTDPPYGIGFDGQKASINKNPKHNRKEHEFMGWDSETPPKELIDLAISKAAGSIIWGGNYFDLPPSRGWLFWGKGQDGQLTSSDGELAWTNYDMPLRAMTINRCFLLKDGSKHPTQKPIALMQWCISQAKNNPQTILDPFMGSGTTGVACVNLGRKFTGIEREPKYFDIACRRVEDAYRQQRLFA